MSLASLAGSVPATAEASIADKQAEAQSVLAQIQEIDVQLGAAIEAWNGAKLRLSKIEADLKANARQLKIKYVIWDQRIWNIERDREGWRFMASRGSDTANHKDHVHVTLYDG